MNLVCIFWFSLTVHIFRVNTECTKQYIHNEVHTMYYNNEFIKYFDIASNLNALVKVSNILPFSMLVSSYIE